MGVIKRNENLFEIRCTDSEETLYIPSNDEEESISLLPEGERESPILVSNRCQRQRPSTIGPSLSKLKNHSGKKKFRRFYNANQLMTLMEEEEPQEVTIEDFIEGSKSAFAVLLEDENSLKKWNDFISSSEEQQRELIQYKTKKKDCSNQPVINRALRSLVRKKNLPLGILDYLEREVISFFSAEPTKTYISPVLSSFERLLLHSVSNYYRLTSLSFVSEPENIKLVRVKNPRKDFPLRSLHLVQYLKLNYEIN